MALLSGGFATVPGFIGGVDPVKILGDPVAQRFYRDGHDPFVLMGNLRATRLLVLSGDAVTLPLDQQVEPDMVQAYTAVEQRILGLSRTFVGAARRAGIAVRYRQEPGIHEHPLLRQELPVVLKWMRAQFGKPAPVPRRWAYRTVAQTSDVYGFRFRFHRPPTTLITFARDRGRLSATGAAVVDVRSPDGRHFTVTVPFKNHRLGP